jgi:hypothetical protein
MQSAAKPECICSPEFEQSSDRAWSMFRDDAYEIGGPRLSAVPRRGSARGHEFRATAYSQSKVTVNADASTVWGMEREVKAEPPRCGQLAASVLKPSAWRVDLQWCLPLRRQQAGTPASGTRSMGSASPANNRKSNKLAARRRIGRRILLHHSQL